jgi:hypothetical protein
MIEGRSIVSQQSTDILEILRFELKFLESGGYARSKSSWRAPYIFEDSPTCLNFNDKERTHPCSECRLIRLVPTEYRGRDVPCRFIPLNEKGETVDSLYQTGTEAEMEKSLRSWLIREINQIEKERAKARAI